MDIERHLRCDTKDFHIISCIGSSPERAVCEFSDHDSFITNMENWKEPDSYSFTYDLRYGDSFVTSPVKVTLKNGTAAFEFEGGDEIFNDDMSYVFNIEFKTHSGYGVYPALFDEDPFRINVKQDYDGYGGIYIKVLDIKIDCPE